MEIPIACTLGPGDARSQLDEWHEVLRRVVDRSDRVTPRRLELGLVPGADIAPVIDLARREVACCPFFAFSILIRAERLVLAVEVPDDAVAVLDELARTTG